MNIKIYPYGYIFYLLFYFFGIRLKKHLQLVNMKGYAMIRLSNGVEFEYVNASGALNYDGNGYLPEQPLRMTGYLNSSLPRSITIAKSLTFNPNKGNFKWYWPWGCIRPIWDGGEIIGVHNAYGLTNPGYLRWCRKIGSRVDSSKIRLAVSICGEPDELAEMAAAVSDFDIVAVEVNVGCPNTKGGVKLNPGKIIESCHKVKSRTQKPVFLKVSVAHQGVMPEILKGIEDVVEVLEINSVPWDMVFPGRKSPLAKFGGGAVSGKIVQRITWPFAELLTSMTQIPVVWPSMWDYSDIGLVEKVGAQAKSFGSVYTFHPWRPTAFIRRKEKSR
ncbi:MAG: hypothetical protein ABSF55_00075 [Candidatus Staskawiczbacteria bacterium]|jgi:hypothetical protein